MKKIKNLAQYIYVHHLFRYLVVGGSTFVLDVGVLISCHELLEYNLAISASIAYWVSVVYNFSLNRWWTFDAKEEKALHQHALFYGILLAVNYAFTVLFLNVASHFIYYGVAKVMSTIIQTFWTYPLYKHVIFKKNS